MALAEAPSLVGEPEPVAARRREHSFASESVGAHLRRGLIGFGPLVLAVFLWPRMGWVAVVPAAVGVVALRGCPLCWTVGLVQTLSRRRLRAVCTDGACRLEVAGGSKGAGTVRR